MWALSYINSFIDFYKRSVTLEIVITLHQVAAFILSGSKITTNLLIYKICNLTDISDFNNVTISDSIDCHDLTWIDEHGEQVMKDVNNFQVSVFHREIPHRFNLNIITLVLYGMTPYISKL